MFSNNYIFIYLELYVIISIAFYIDEYATNQMPFERDIKRKTSISTDTGYQNESEYAIINDNDLAKKIEYEVFSAQKLITTLAHNIKEIIELEKRIYLMFDSGKPENFKRQLR